MKSHRYTVQSVLCPLYKEQDAQRIFCLGIEPGHTIDQNVDAPAHRENFQIRHCKTNYESCPIFLAHMILEGEIRPE